VGWRRGKQGGIYSLVDGGGGAAHRKRRRRGGGITRGTRGGEQHRPGALPMRHTSEKRNERGGYGGRKPRADTCAGERGRTVRGGKASAAPGHGHASAAHVGPATNGFRRTCSDSDPTSVEWSPSTGARSNWRSNYSRPLMAVLSLSLFSLFLSLLNPGCTSLSYKL
jgi:hypothetical protein